MQTIPLDLMLWLSLGVIGLGVVFFVPIWWRGRARRAGRGLPIDETDVGQRNLACSFLLFGIMGVIGTGLTAASQVMSFGGFMAFVAAWLAIVFWIAFRVDARRHR